MVIAPAGHPASAAVEPDFVTRWGAGALPRGSGPYEIERRPRGHLLIMIRTRGRFTARLYTSSHTIWRPALVGDSRAFLHTSAPYAWRLLLALPSWAKKCHRVIPGKGALQAPCHKRSVDRCWRAAEPCRQAACEAADKANLTSFVGSFNDSADLCITAQSQNRADFAACGGSSM